MKSDKRIKHRPAGWASDRPAELDLSPLGGLNEPLAVPSTDRFERFTTKTPGFAGGYLISLQGWAIQWRQ